MNIIRYNDIHCINYSQNTMLEQEGDWRDWKMICLKNMSKEEFQEKIMLLN